MGILTTNVATVNDTEISLFNKAIISNDAKEIVISNFVFSDTAPADTSKIWGDTNA